MTDLKFNDVKKQNLISVLFALEFVADGVTKFIDDKFKSFHTKLVNMTQPFSYQSCAGKSDPCSQKHPRDLQNWCSACGGWRNCILNSHKDRSSIGRRGVDWSKIDSSKWPSDPKEVEKCYHPKWCNSAKTLNYSDNDPAVLLWKLINCNDMKPLFQNSVDPEKIKDIRNSIHHDTEIPDGTKQQHLTIMTDFLTKTADLWSYPEAQEAHQKIQLFQSKNYIDIVKDEALEEDELKRIEERITSGWNKCYTIPLVTVLTAVCLCIAIMIPLAWLGLSEFKKKEYYPYIDLFLQKMFTSPEWKESISCDNFSMITRENWGAVKPKGSEFMPSPILHVFVHHTGGIHCDEMAQCIKITKGTQRDHMHGNGWDDVGYNFLVGEDGNVYEGRGWNSIGAHTKGWNRNSVSFAFIGNYNDQRPNSKSIKALRTSICWGLKNGKISPNYILFGHRDKRPTDSPGHYLYAIISEFEHFHKNIDSSKK